MAERDTFVSVSDGDQLNQGYFNGIYNPLNVGGTNALPMLVPIGAMVPWLKTFDLHDSGTTDGTTANKLVESGQNFTSTVTVGDVVHNTTDDTFAYVTAIDSDTTLSIDADIMVSGEAYSIYATPALPAGWLECDGSVISDATSPYNGATLPDMNGNNYFPRGSISSGATGGSETHRHQTPIGNTGTSAPAAGDDIVISYGGGNETFADGNSGSEYNIQDTTNFNVDLSGATNVNLRSPLTSATSTLPSYYEVVWIMRIK